MQERRRFVRIPEHSEISYKVLPGSKIKRFISENISQGGIRFFVDEPIAINSLIEIELILQDIPFLLKTVVKARWLSKDPHSERYEIGGEFINIPQEAEQFIHYIYTKVLRRTQAARG